MKDYILSIDQGTSSSRAILFDKQGNPSSIQQKEFRQIFPQPGWVEHDAMEILSTQFHVIEMLLADYPKETSHIAAIGITNQRETTVVWEKATGKPVYNAIVWQDKRTSERCAVLKATGWSSYILQHTGLLIDSYFSATKLAWILDNIPEGRERGRRGEILFGTIDSWLLWNLTGGKKHATDFSNASRTMLFNIHTLNWDQELLNLFDIPEAMLPEVLNSSDDYGFTEHPKLPKGIPIRGMIGDQQSALFGQGCLSAGDSKNTYGTGCFMLLNTGDKCMISKNGLLTTIAWGLGGKITYAMEGSVFIAGAAIQWLRDGLKIIDSTSDVEHFANQLSDNEGVYIVPSFTGLGAPYWNMHARGAMFGITRGTTRGHYIRATLESMAYQTYDVLKAMEADTSISISQLKVDGGASKNDFLMQFQADILQCKVIRPKNSETTAFGAALMAGYYTGFYKPETHEFISITDHIFSPKMEEHIKTFFLKKWHKAIQLTIDWTSEV
jgi:glycerol kinase